MLYNYSMPNTPSQSYGYQKEGSPDGTSPVSESQESIFGRGAPKYGPDHIYTRIAAVHGLHPFIVHRACELAKTHGICIQTYADPVHAAAMLAHMGYIAQAQNAYASEPS